MERITSVESLNIHLPCARVLIVVPTYNERENIESLLHALAEQELPVDILVADDGSPDGTAEVVRALAPRISRRMYLMQRAGKFGLGVAYLDAYRWALTSLPDYRVIVQMDADFSHDPPIVPLLVEKARAYGVAIGSRYVQGGAAPDWNHWRYLLSRSGNVYARWILRLFFPSYLLQDSTSGFVAWRRDVLDAVLRYPIFGDGYAYQTAIKLVAFRLGYPPIEVPIIFRDRRLGVSKLNRNIVFEAFNMPWRLGRVFRRPLAEVALDKPLHDNTIEMWDRYYSANEGERTSFFARIIHWAREVYFGKLFARRVIELGGQASSYVEIGVGTAQTLERLALMTGARSVGVEKTPRAFEQGKAYAKHAEITLGDGMSMPFPDASFDVAYSLGLLEHFEPDEQARLLREQARVAKNWVLVEVPTRTWHMRLILWINRKLFGKRGVWADEELFTPEHFKRKYPGLPFKYFFDWKSGAMTCWFALKPEDVKKYVPAA